MLYFFPKQNKDLKHFNIDLTLYEEVQNMASFYFSRIIKHDYKGFFFIFYTEEGLIRVIAWLRLLKKAIICNIL